MYREFTLRLEAVIAHIALEWLVLCMNSLVCPKVGVSFKALAASLAFARPLLWMQCHVRLELRNGLRKGI